MIKRIKNIFCTNFIMTNLFLIISILILSFCAFKPINYLFNRSVFNTIITLIILIVGFILFYFIFNKINIKNKKIEYLIIILITLVGLGLRIGANAIIKTEPVSDFATVHSAHRLSKQGEIFESHEFTKDNSFYQTYYALYPSWFPYMKVVSVIYDAFGVNLLYIKILNWFLYVLTAMVLYLIGKHFLSTKNCIFGLLLFAISPSLVVYSNITTPDHITILLFSCFIITLFNVIKYREEAGNKKFIYAILNCFTIVGINLFKPLSVFGNVVLICTELLCFSFPSLFDKEKRKMYFKKQILFSVIYILISILLVFTSSKLLTTYVQKEIKTKVVNSTGLYMLWAYSLDTKNQYNPNIQSKYFDQLYDENEKDLEKMMPLINKKAKEQFINNLPQFFNIIDQKCTIAFQSESDILSFANYSTKENQAWVEANLRKPYLYSATIFMFGVLLLSVISLLKELVNVDFKSKHKIILTLIIVGYFMVLLLGGIQARYKTLVIVPLCLLASSAIKFKESGEKIC